LRRVLPRLVLCILALARTASAQIAMPGGVALSPFPVLESPAAYRTFDDNQGGVWAFFLGAQSGSGLYAQHVHWDGSYQSGFDAAARLYAKSGTLVNNFSAAPDGLGGAVVSWFGVNAQDSTSQFLALRFLHIVNNGSLASSSIPDTGIVVSSIASAALTVGDGAGGAYVVWEEVKGPSNPDIFAQHYDNAGHPTWTPSGSPSGQPVCAVVGLQHLRALHADGSGGAYVVWADSRVGTTVPVSMARRGPRTACGCRPPRRACGSSDRASRPRVASGSHGATSPFPPSSARSRSGPTGASPGPRWGRSSPRSHLNTSTSCPPAAATSS